MTDTLQNDSTAPPVLEQLGALCSLLIHDLANQLCIISGSATFAQMVAGEPERVAHSLKAIIQAGEKAGHALGSCGELRRALSDTVPPSDLSLVLEQLGALIGRQSGWSLDVEEGLTGVVRMPAIWVAFGVECLIKEVRVTGGTVCVRRVRRDTGDEGDRADGSAAHGGACFLQVALNYASDQAFALKEVRTRYDHLGLLAAFELNRCLGGRIETGSCEPGRQEVWFECPFVSSDS
jgi:hypothetical protein